MSETITTHPIVTIKILGGAVKAALEITGASGRDYAGACVTIEPVGSTVPEGWSYAAVRKAIAWELSRRVSLLVGVPAGLKRGILGGTVSVEVPNIPAGRAVAAVAQSIRVPRVRPIPRGRHAITIVRRAFVGGVA